MTAGKDPNECTAWVAGTVLKKVWAGECVKWLNCWVFTGTTLTCVKGATDSFVVLTTFTASWGSDTGAALVEKLAMKMANTT